MITILFVHNQILKSHVTFLLQAGIGCVLNYTCKSNLKKKPHYKYRYGTNQHSLSK